MRVDLRAPRRVGSQLERDGDCPSDRASDNEYGSTETLCGGDSQFLAGEAVDAGVGQEHEERSFEETACAASVRRAAKKR